MKKFMFSLNKVLRYREYVERGKEQKFSEIRVEVLNLEKEIELANIARVEALKAGLSGVLEGVEGVEGGVDGKGAIKGKLIDLRYSHYASELRQGLSAKIKMHETLKAHRKTELAKARKELAKAQREREALEFLAKKERERYMQEYENVEQRVLEEVSQSRARVYGIGGRNRVGGEWGIGGEFSKAKGFAKLRQRS